MDSIYDDSCWEQWGWQRPGPDYVVSDEVVAMPLGAVEHQLSSDEGSSMSADPEDEDSFSDWYGNLSACDHLSRGRREEVLGKEWVDEVAFFGPPPSRLRMALDSHTQWSSDDPSSKKMSPDERKKVAQLSTDERKRVAPDTDAWEDELFMVVSQVGSDDDGSVDDETNNLVETFLSSGTGCEDWSRTSVHVSA